MAVKQAFDNKVRIEGIPTATTFVPFYVDLKQLVVPASLRLTSNKVAAENSALPPTHLAACIDATFSEAADSFEVRLVEDLRTAFRSRLYAEIRLWIFTKFGFTVSAPASASPATPSIERHLERFIDAAGSYQHALSARSFFNSPRGCIPVLVVDEVHLLDRPELLKIRHELVAFLFKHAAAKSMAPVVLVLLSSESTAPEILASWGDGYDLAKLFQRNLVGDVPRQHLKEFLTQLPREASASQGASETNATPLAGLSRWNERIADDTRFAEAFELYGGYVSDWIRLYNAQMVAGDYDVVLTDVSKVSHLTAGDTAQQLREKGLDPADVLQTFRAICKATSLSPRGAVIRNELIYNRDGRSVPHAALQRMFKENLVEIRRGNPDMLDYAELRPLVHDVYVCAPCPLARTSMEQVVRILEAEEEQRKVQH